MRTSRGKGTFCHDCRPFIMGAGLESLTDRKKRGRKRAVPKPMGAKPEPAEAVELMEEQGALW